MELILFKLIGAWAVDNYVRRIMKWERGNMKEVCVSAKKSVSVLSDVEVEN